MPHILKVRSRRWALPCAYRGLKVLLERMRANCIEDGRRVENYHPYTQITLVLLTGEGSFKKLLETTTKRLVSFAAESFEIHA